ncbi:MAG: peptidase M14 [bacterium]|nr:peptidase M14 [bacterium]
MKTNIKTVIIAILAICVLMNATPGLSQGSSDPQFKVKIDFNRWHDYYELKEDFKELEKAFPKLLKYTSVGQTAGGKDMMLITINNPDTGPELSKAAMYIEANIHGNEIQGGEVVLYTAWYLMENYDSNEEIKRIVDERVFYLFPCVNPDGRQYFMDETGTSSRTGHFPVDDDGDGMKDEDPAEDINGNGVIDTIRKYVPGQGNYRVNLKDPRIMEPVPEGEVGDYVLLGREGIDSDNDGLVNEDGPGSYDPNRNWAADWQPDYVQRGAMKYPFQLPAAKAVNDFLMTRPNISGVQSYHNSGGMILRGPGSQTAGEYPAADLKAYDEMGKHGERILPYYRYIILWRDLYPVHGGFIDWTNDGLGIISYSNELWSGRQYWNSSELEQQRQEDDSPIRGQLGNYYFDDKLEFGDEFVDWAEFDHPDYGKVEMGGWKKTRGRLPPRFMNEELCHRNMAFSIYQADEMPLMKVGETKVEKISGDVYKVWVDFSNPKVVSTITAVGSRNNVVRPDLVTLDGRNAEIISAGWVADKFQPKNVQMIKQHDLNRIQIGNGHPGKTTRTIEYLVKGSGRINIKYSSAKGGTVEATVELR